MHGWQSASTAGLKGGWRVGLSIYLSIYIYLDLSISIYIYLYLSISYQILKAML